MEVKQAREAIIRRAIEMAAIWEHEYIFAAAERFEHSIDDFEQALREEWAEDVRLPMFDAAEVLDEAGLKMLDESIAQMAEPQDVEAIARLAGVGGTFVDEERFDSWWRNQGYPTDPRSAFRVGFRLGRYGFYDQNDPAVVGAERTRWAKREKELVEALRLVRAAARDLATTLEIGDTALIILAAARFTVGERARDAVDAALGEERTTDDK